MAPPNTTVSFRIPAAKVDALARLAAIEDRDRSYLLNQAVDQYLALHEQHAAHIREGLRQSQAGHLVSHETARAKIQGLIRKAGKK